MKKILLTLCSALIATASFAQEEWTTNVDFKRPQCMHEKVQTRAIANISKPTYLPHTGSPRILTILVNFKDSAFAVNTPRKAFDQFFNAEKIENLGNSNTLNQGSVNKYFQDMSNGKFSPKFDIYGPVNLPHEMSYYGGTDKNEKNGEGENHRQLTLDAIALIKDSINDITIYDSNNDKYVDCVYILYAGVGQNNGGDGTTVWANTGSVAGTYTDKKGNQLNLGFFSMACELQYNLNTSGNVVISGVGVTCHELSHALGLPDVYPTEPTNDDKTNPRAANNQEMEKFDLMDGGEYLRSGFCPAPYTAWQKYQMEWGNDNIEVLTKSGKITMSEASAEGGKTYKIQNPSDKKEYFLIENVIKKNWSLYMPASGLMAYHVVDNSDGLVRMGGCYNNVKNKPRMAIIPADGNCLSAYINENEKYEESLTHDLFPNADKAKAINDDLKLPNFYWYTSSNAKALYNSNYYKTNVALKNISVDSTGKITFDYVADTTVTAINELNSDEENALSSAIYSLDGRYMGTDSSVLPAGIYIKNHKKFVAQ